MVLCLSDLENIWGCSFPFPCLSYVPELINTPALFNSDLCLSGSVLSIPSHSLYIACYFPLILIPSVVDEPSVSHVLAIFYDHSLGPRSSIGASLVRGELFRNLSCLLSAGSHRTFCYHILIMKEFR